MLSLSFGIFVLRECDISEEPPLVVACAGVWNAIVVFTNCRKYGLTQGPNPLPIVYRGFLWLIGRDEVTPTAFICEEQFRCRSVGDIWAEPCGLLREIVNWYYLSHLESRGCFC